MDSINIQTEAETALLLKVKENTLINMRRRKKIKGFRQGHEWFYRMEDIKAYIEGKFDN